MWAVLVDLAGMFSLADDAHSWHTVLFTVTSLQKHKGRVHTKHDGSSSENLLLEFDLWERHLNLGETKQRRGGAVWFSAFFQNSSVVH